MLSVIFLECCKFFHELELPKTFTFKVGRHFLPQWVEILIQLEFQVKKHIPVKKCSLSNIYENYSLCQLNLKEVIWKLQKTYYINTKFNSLIGLFIPDFKLYNLPLFPGFKHPLKGIAKIRIKSFATLVIFHLPNPRSLVSGVLVQLFNRGLLS